MTGLLFRTTPLLAAMLLAAAIACGCGTSQTTTPGTPKKTNPAPSGSVGHFAAGVALEEQGRIDEAILEYEKAWQCDHESAFIAVRLGAALWRANRREQAKPHIIAAEKAAASEPKIALKLAQFYLHTNRFEDTMRMCTILAATKRYENEAHHISAEALLNKDEPKKAEALLEKLVRVRHENRDWILLGRAREGLRQPSRAAAAYAHAASDPAAALKAIEIYASLGNFANALDITRRHLWFIPPETSITGIVLALPPSPISSINPWHWNPKEQTRRSVLRSAYVRIAWHALTHRNYKIAHNALAESIARTGEYAEAHEFMKAINAMQKDKTNPTNS